MMKRIATTLITLTLMPFMALATTWYVNGMTGSDENSGVSISCAKKTIQAAIDASLGGDVLIVYPGTYLPIQTNDKWIKIQSVEGPERTFIDGKGVTVNRWNTMIRRGTDFGLTTNTVLVGFTIRNCISTDGGTIRHCIIRNNDSSSIEGGAVNQAVVENCLLVDNVGKNGAAGEGSVFRCCTITRNSAINFGACLNSIVENSIVWGNANDSLSMDNTRRSFTYWLQQRLETDSRTGAYVYCADPGFVDPQNGDYRLRAGSPCVDAGDNLYVAGVSDIDDNARIVNGRVDIGCYELQRGEKLYAVIDVSSGFESDYYPVEFLDAEPVGGWAKEYKTTKIVLRRIPAQTFLMQNKYKVTLSEDYYIGVFEITQKQWECVMGTHPSLFYGDTRPVECVSYDDIRGCELGSMWPQNANVDEHSFLGRLRARSGIVNVDLPTEAQWECVANADVEWYFENVDYYNDRLVSTGRFIENQEDGRADGSREHVCVGSYLPNIYGLFDTYGNVGEWCCDWFGDHTGTLIDPRGPLNPLYNARVVVGQSWGASAVGSWSARGGMNPSNAQVAEENKANRGFRLCMTGDVSAPKRCAINFDSNYPNGSVLSSNVFSGTIITMPKPEHRAGYDFAGWYTAAEDGVRMSEDIVVSTDSTWYAHWAVIPDQKGSQDGTEPMAWCDNFQIAYEYANTNNLPLIVVWSNQGCWQCERLHEVLTNDVVVAWLTNTNFVSTYLVGDIAGKEFARNSSGLFPYVAVYWNMGGGITNKVTFTGRDGTMLKKKGTLAEQFMASVEKAIGEMRGDYVDPDVRTIIFDANGGSGDFEYSVREIGYRVGPFPDVSRVGYYLIGWFTERDGGEQVYSDKEVEDNATYYAHWEFISDYIWDYSMHDEDDGRLCVIWDCLLPLSCNGVLSFPESLECSDRTIMGEGAFGGREDIRSVVLSAQVEGSDEIGFSFWHCHNMTNIEVVSDNDEFCSVDGLLLSKDSTRLCMVPRGCKSCIVPQGVVEIGAAAFAGNTNLTQVVLPTSVQYIGHQAFNYCSGLISVTIPASVTGIGDGVFDGCGNLKEIYVDGDYRSCFEWLDVPSEDLTIYVYDDTCGWPSSDEWYHVERISRPASSVHSAFFDANGGACLTTIAEVVDGTAVGTLPTATRSGYDFLGWFTAEVGGEQVSVEMVVTADVTWYAHWTPIIYGISYVGSMGGVNANVKTYTVEDTVTFSALPDVAGYRFTGWSPSSIAKGSTGEKTVTAHYMPIAYAISYVDTKDAVNPNPSTYMVEDAITFAALPDVDGWKFVGWSSTGIAKGNVGIVTVVAYWEPVLPPIVSDDDEPMDASIANTYDGVIVDADGLPMGYITVKAAKASGKGDAKVSKVTATIQMVGETKKVTVKANVAVAEATMTQAATDGRVLDLTFSRYGIWGTFDDYEIDGVRNLLASTAASDKGTDAKIAAESACNALKGNYVMAYGDENGYNGLSVTIMAKGKVKVSGKLSNGTSVSTTSQLIVGEDYSVIPVIYTKKDTSLAFNIYFTNDGSEAKVFGYYDAVISTASSLDEGLSFCVGESICDMFEDYVLLDEFLPYDVSVEPKGKKWVVAGGAAAGKIKIVNGEAVDSKESDNPSGLKLTFNAKAGTFSGSFKVYALDSKSKLKTFTATVSGVVVDGLGYGVATIKGLGSVAVTIE